MREIVAKDVIKYATLPRIVPRVFGLFNLSFIHLAYLVAIIYRSVGLLPAGHPLLNGKNIGKYGIRHVIAEAANNLKITKNNIDQILVFIAILFAFVIIVFQIVAILIAIATPDAVAADFADFFITMSPRHDIAFILLDRVFGIEGIFDSCVLTGATDPCQRLVINTDLANLTSASVTVNGITYDYTYPPMTYVNGDEVSSGKTVFHVALASMFQFYSSALLVVAFIIFLYYIIVIIAETAQTGTPFGKRFNSVWAPLRMVFALGILIPLNTGYNGAQYMVLYAAKWGSGLATNGWLAFTGELGAGTNMVVQNNPEEMIAIPKEPNPAELLNFMRIAKTCRKYYETENVCKDGNNKCTGPAYTLADIGSNYFSLDNPAAGPPQEAGPKNGIKAYLVRSQNNNPNYLPFIYTTYDEALDFYGSGDVMIRFGVRDVDAYNEEKGHVSPICGEVVLKTGDLAEPGSKFLRTAYYNELKRMWLEDFETSVEGITGDVELSTWSSVYVWNEVKNFNGDLTEIEADSAAFKNLVEQYRNQYKAIIEAAVIEQATKSYAAISPEFLNRGWAAAGMWYNRIAEMNGAFIASARDIGTVSKKPSVMQEIARKKAQVDENVSAEDECNPTLSDGKAIKFDDGDLGRGMAKLLCGIDKAIDLSDISEDSRSHANDNNIWLKTISFIFGLDGLFSFRDNEDVHPLAQLSGLGKTLIDNTINRVLLASGASMGKQAIAKMLNSESAALADAFASAAWSIATIGLAAGFLLYYVLPFMPFVYFFFAVGTWVKSIFEAMVGVPLWALAHIRIDGNGLPGDAAMNGYYLIFEIFLRPILILFGLLASVTIFAALARVLNEVWDVVTDNVAGYDSSIIPASGAPPPESANFRGAVDQLFFTVMYVIIIYMLATSCFKLIDLIPNQILRWMGASVTTFGDSNEGAAEKISQYAAFGGSHITGQLTSAGQSATSAIGSLGGGKKAE